MDPWKLFEKNVNKTLDKDSKSKRIIPVVGSGFNLQAARDSDNWISLLLEIGRELNLPAEDLEITKLSQMSATATWEYFITKVAFKDNQSASSVEDDLKRIVQRQLNRFEDSHKEIKFYGEFLDMGFRDILSLNFDRTLVMDRKNKLVNSDYAGDRELFKNFKNHTFTLFRHIQIDNPQQTRVWYPHGDTRLCDSIKLGIREYGIYIKSIDEARNSYMKAWMAFLDRKNFNFYKNREIFTIEKYRKYWKIWTKELRDHEETNWAWLFFSSPIVFIGCGLSSDEWPMWWTLHQRARIFARLPEKDKEPAFVFWNVKTNPPQTEWLKKGPGGITVLPIEDWKEGWERLLTILKS